MPELPETETIARYLNARAAGHQIARVDVLRPDVLRTARRRSWQVIAGESIEGVERRAKSIVIRLTGGHRLVVTPRFTGGLFWRQTGAPGDPYDALRLECSGERLLAYRDVRRLGTVALLSRKEWELAERRLGPEPLAPEFSLERFLAFLRGSRRAVKSALMDQAKLAGVGNIYATESLWLAGIDPSRLATTLSAVEGGELYTRLRELLTLAIDAGGTTFRDYRSADGSRGGFASQLEAYGRAGQPCSRCGTRLVGTDQIDFRMTVFCYRCQR